MNPANVTQFNIFCYPVCKLNYYAINLLFYRNCKQFGTQSWVLIAIIMLEFVIVCKFDWKTVTMAMPRHMAIFWILFITAIMSWTIWHFYLKRLLWHTECRIDKYDIDEPGGKVKLKDLNENIEKPNHNSPRRRGRNVRNRSRKT